jgi:hypothetical protein
MNPSVEVSLLEGCDLFCVVVTHAGGWSTLSGLSVEHLEQLAMELDGRRDFSFYVHVCNGGPSLDHSGGSFLLSCGNCEYACHASISDPDGIFARRFSEAIQAALQSVPPRHQ